MAHCVLQDCDGPGPAAPAWASVTRPTMPRLPFLADSRKVKYYLSGDGLDDGRSRDNQENLER